MKKPIFCAAVFAAALLMHCVPAHAQFFKKLKDKVNQAIDKKVSSAAGLPTDNGAANTPANGTANTAGGPVNKTGAGLKNTAPPDVNQNIDVADKANTSADYSNARYALQQAMVGIEIELGKQLLHSLPGTISGLNQDTTKNLVASNAYGWNNLTVETVYSDGKDKQMTITIGNNPAYAGLAAMFLNNSAYLQNNNNSNQNIKQTRLKGNPALLQFEASEGYTLFMQMGQSSMIIWKFVNFSTEDEVMNAAATFDIDAIKKTMGEQ